jgi:hypothetical protein
VSLVAQPFHPIANFRDLVVVHFYLILRAPLPNPNKNAFQNENKKNIAAESKKTGLGKGPFWSKRPSEIILT